MIERTAEDHNERESKRPCRLNDELDDLFRELDCANDDEPPPPKEMGGPKQTIAMAKSKMDGNHFAPTSFPVNDIKSLPVVIDPIGRLEALMAELRRHGNYGLVRDEYCQLSILLNLQGALAPAFRPQPKTGKRKGDPIFFVIHRDQLVIDCHWLSCKQFPIKPRDSEFKPMFNKKGTFPFDLAWTFATKKWTSLHRTNEALSLTFFQQCQLVTMRGKTVTGRFEASLEGVRRSSGRIPAKIAEVRQGLNEWCERDTRMIPYRDDYENLWLARELLGNDAPTRQIAELFALMTGSKTRDDKTIREKLKKLNGHIGGV